MLESFAIVLLLVWGLGQATFGVWGGIEHALPLLALGCVLLRVLLVHRALRSR